MAFKFICVVFLLSAVFLSAQAKQKKEHEKEDDKQHDVEVVPVHFDTLNYLGNKITCTDYNKKYPGSAWCNCPFVFCTGAQQCLQMDFAGSEDISCNLKHTNIDYTSDLGGDDCGCTYDKK